MLFYYIYYIAYLFLNVFLISLYAVQVVAKHENCVNRSGQDTTEFFRLLFNIGFCLHVVEFVNAQVFCVYFRCKVVNQPSPDSDNQSLIVEFADRYFFKVATLVLSYVQFHLKHSHLTRFCVSRLRLLKDENFWFTVVIIIQVTKVLIFSAWSFYLPKAKDANQDRYKANLEERNEIKQKN